MIVDDDLGLLRALQILVEDETGRRVATAPSALESLRLLDLHDDIGAMLVDLALPGMDGIELAHRVQRDHPGIVVILMSAHAESLRSSEARSIRAAGYFAKPIDPDRLLRAIDEALETPAG